MNSEIPEKELATFLDEQSSYLAPIPIKKLQRHIHELEKNNTVAQDPTTNNTPTDHVVHTQSPTDHVVSKKGNTSPITEKIDLLIVVTKQDAYHIAKSSETEDSEASLLIKNLLKAQSGKLVFSKTHQLLKDRDYLILSELSSKENNETEPKAHFGNGTACTAK